MYSVLIQNQSTMESFHEFHPFFMEEILNDQIGVCRWIESGDSVDTALPEIRELTADKEQWRAIIVRVTDEVEMKEAKADAGNPYDFAVNKEMPAVLEESAVPLIRLTHILGGVPAPLVEFQEQNLKNGIGKVVHVVYKPVRNPEREAAHERLEEKYKYNGKRPTEIFLVTFHKKAHRKESVNVQFVWNNYLESDSSEFWRRNNYPATCRFLKYDYEELGPIQRTADLFNFWMSVMLLARNDITSSSLQGYRIYNVRTDFDREKMARVFQAQVDTLVGTKNYIGMEIKRDLEAKASIDDTAVMDFAYVEGLEINVDIPRDAVMRVAENEFHLCGRTSSEDFSKWEGMKGVVESNLEALYKRADRELEKGTDLMRLRQHVNEEDVKPINHFQEEDVLENLDGLYVQILNGQSELTGLTKRNQVKLEEKAQAVKENIVQRVIRAHTFTVMEAVVGIVAVCCIPCIIFRKVEIAPTILPSIFLTLGMIIVYIIAEFATLKIQHFRFLRKVDAYNEEVERSQEDLENCTKNLTEFVRNVVSYSRGCDYLNILEHKKFKTGYTYDALQRHMKATNLFLEKLQRWSRAFYMDTNFQPETQDNFRIDIELSPQSNYLYTFENGKDYAVPLNETGDEVYSPFEFVKKLNIDREELFEDARVDESNCDTDCADGIAYSNSDSN